MDKNMKYAAGRWLHTKLDFYAMCKTKFKLSDEEIAEVMGIPEFEVTEMAKVVVLDKEAK